MISDDIYLKLDMDQMGVLGDIAGNIIGEGTEGGGPSHHVVSLVNEENESEVAVLIEVNDMLDVEDITEEISDFLTEDVGKSAKKISEGLEEDYGELGYTVVMSTNLIDEILRNLEKAEVKSWDDLYDVSLDNWDLTLRSQGKGWAIYPEIDLSPLRRFNPAMLEPMTGILLPPESYALISLSDDTPMTLYLGFNPDLFMIGNLDLEDRHNGKKIGEMIKANPKDISEELFEYFEVNHGTANLGFVAKVDDLRDLANQIRELPGDERIGGAFEIFAEAVDSGKLVIRLRPLLRPFFMIAIKTRALIRPLLNAFLKI